MFGPDGNDADYSCFKMIKDLSQPFENHVLG